MLSSREELQKARAAYKKALDNEKIKVLVCAGTGCIASGAMNVYDRLAAIIKNWSIRKTACRTRNGTKYRSIKNKLVSCWRNAAA
jgi:NADH:ubiquinone oxidoreductase subunit E